MEVPVDLFFHRDVETQEEEDEAAAVRMLLPPPLRLLLSPVFDETMATTEGADPAQLVAATPAATGFEAGAAATGGGYEASWEGGQPDAAASQW
jgi:hypothetical protein